MRKSSIEAIVAALNDHQVQYLIVGGLAVVAHGYVRFTADVDIVLALEPGNLRRAIEALGSLGYGPRVPVAFSDLLDAEARRRWETEKHMVVLSLVSDAHRATEVDLFIRPPMNFAEAYARAARHPVAPGVEATFCGLDDLIAMKAAAGRPRDQQDIAELRRLRGADE